ncbi:hypothetical protein SDC9_64088 [bioreactor metagenome]|uniref:Uncharacterized protein n=1 Tax=bioreactor metagenome TaxID=1076179 RepID=A0A644XPJ2_9ZZZZ
MQKPCDKARAHSGTHGGRGGRNWRYPRHHERSRNGGSGRDAALNRQIGIVEHAVSDKDADCHNAPQQSERKRSETNVGNVGNAHQNVVPFRFAL